MHQMLGEGVAGESNFKIDIEYINHNWDINNSSYYISSHRPIIGDILVKGRELVHAEVCRYVDPMVWKQKEFNERVVRIQNQIMKKVDDAVDEKVRNVLAEMNMDIKNKAMLAGILEGRIERGLESLSPASQSDGFNYYLFEERFRLSRDVIKQRQSAFVRFFEHCNNVLDIGCGRGEFLELLKAKGIGAHGVDIDNYMVDYCKSIDLDVEKIDAIAYLEKVDDESLDGIFIDQVVEHLEPDYLIKMLGLCYKKMKYGHHIIIETVNPLSLVSFANFYIDLTHKKPMHPETLKFLLGSVSFREIETKFIAPIPDEARLKKMEKDDKMDDRKRKRIDSYNQNIDMLNNILYGAQDYMVIGKK